MALRSVPDQQLGMDEKVVELPALEEALDERQAAKAAAGEARKAYKEAHALALELPEGVAVRAGAYRITRSAVSARSVAFETSPTDRLTITWLGEGE